MDYKYSRETKEARLKVDLIYNVWNKKSEFK